MCATFSISVRGQDVYTREWQIVNSAMRAFELGSYSGMEIQTVSTWFSNKKCLCCTRGQLPLDRVKKGYGSDRGGVWEGRARASNDRSRARSPYATTIMPQAPRPTVPTCGHHLVCVLLLDALSLIKCCKRKRNEWGWGHLASGRIARLEFSRSRPRESAGARRGGGRCREVRPPGAVGVGGGDPDVSGFVLNKHICC